jgi:hypothetical protein
MGSSRWGGCSLWAQWFQPQDVTDWLGNSEPVAMDHYLQKLPEDVARAATVPTPRTVQKTVQHPAVDPRGESHAVQVASANPADFQSIREPANQDRSLRRK